MTSTTKIHSSGMVQDLKTGGFLVALSKADKEQMAKKKIVAMCADFSGHFCVYTKETTKVLKGRKYIYSKRIEQRERFSTPSAAIAAVK